MINQITPNSVNTSTFAPFSSIDGANYAISKPFTPEQTKAVEQKKEKKTRALGKNIAVTSLVAGFGVLALMRGLPKRFYGKFNKFFGYLEGKINALTSKNKKLKGIQNFYLKTLKIAKTATEKARSLYNIASLKDISIKNGLEKIPFVRRFVPWVTNLVEKISIRTSKSAYEKTWSRLGDMLANFDRVNAQIPKEKFLEKLTLNGETKTISQWLDTKSKNISANFDSAFGQIARDKRLRKVKENLEHLDTNLVRVLKDKRTYQTFLPEALAQQAKLELANEVNPHKIAITNDIQDILTIYKKLLPEKEHLKLSGRTNVAIDSLNNSVGIETDKLFDKLRDLKVGSAPSDALGVLASLGAVGWGLGKADDKDEKISVALKYGIPTVGSVATCLYCAAMLVSGGPSIIIGLLSGVLINQLGVMIDDARKNYKKAPIIFNQLKFPDFKLPTMSDKS